MNAEHVDIMMTFRGSALMGTANTGQISRIQSGVVQSGRRRMEKEIAQMLAVLHLENEFIMKMIIQTHCKPKKRDEIEKEVIETFDNMFNRASEGKLCE